jgi:hypothetical protein
MPRVDEVGMEIGSEGCPSKPVSTLTDLKVKAYENRVRERLIAKYPKRTPAESRNHGPEGIEQTPEFEITDERE